jgi:hypothetical protein
MCIFHRTSQKLFVQQLQLLQLVVLMLFIGVTSARADEGIDGTYLSEALYYVDMLQGNRPVDKSVKLELEFSIQHGQMKFIRIQAPLLDGINRLYSRVRGIGCVYTSLGYPIMYPGTVTNVRIGREIFEIKYDSTGNNIFDDAFILTNLNDGKTQTYQWKDQVGRIWFDDAPLKHDSATQVYSFQVSPEFLPENYAGKYRQEGDIKWFNDITVALSHGLGSGTLKLACPDLSISFKLKKIKTGSE